MSDDTPQAKSTEAKTPNRSEQFADLILKTLMTGGGVGCFWSLFIQTDLPKAALSAAIATGTGYVAIVAKPFHKRNEEQLERIGQAVDKTYDRWITETSGYERKYLEALKAHCDKLKVEGVKGYLKPLPLEKVIVPIRLNADPTNQLRAHHIKSIWELLPNPERLDQAVCRLAIVADPGFGKTTLMRFLTLSYANGSYREHKAKRLIPVLLLLRSIYTQIQEERSPLLPDLIVSEVQKLPLCGELRSSSQWFAEELRKGKCLVMMDGLDEVPESQREKVSRWINWQMQNYPTPFILTSRPHGFDSTLFDQVQQVGIQEFNRQQKADFVYKWYRAREEEYWYPAYERTQVQPEEKQLNREQVEAQTDSDAEESAKVLINQLAQNPAMNQLAGNPLLITIIAITHQASALDELPRRRVALYQEIFKTLLELRPSRRDTQLTLKTAEENQQILQTLAWQLTQQNQIQFKLNQGEIWIKEQLLKFLPDDTLTPKKFLKEIQDIAGLLAGEEGNLYQFTHKSFQEYLAALELNDEIVLQQFENSNWKEEICFYTIQNQPAKWIEHALQLGTRASLLLADRIAKEAGNRVNDGLRDRVRQAIQTAKLGGVLQTKASLEQCFSQLVALDANTAITAELITGAEYQLFLNDQAEERFHSKAAEKQIDFDQEDQPIIDISWEDARWFCAWLSTQAYLQSEEIVYDYRLPTIDELQRVPAQDNLIAWTSSPDRPGNALRIVREKLPDRYRELSNYLANGRWQEADQETYQIMLDIAERTEQGYLDVESIQKFPCEDLRIIDQLWVKFSGGLFGFSVQKQIYVETGNPLDGRFHEGSWEKFCDRVAWRKNKSYVNYPEDVIFDTTAPRAHLPRGVVGGRGRRGIWWWGVSLLSRRDL